MAYYNSFQGCIRHPNSQQLPGVCPCCLRERLNQLFPPRSSQLHTKTRTTLSPNFYSPYYPFSSVSSANSLSPVHRSHNRNASLPGAAPADSVFFTANLGHGLRKSRSIAYVSKQSVGRVIKETKRRGFWSKLLHRKGKTKDNINLVHHRTSLKELLR